MMMFQNCISMVFILFSIAAYAETDATRISTTGKQNLSISTVGNTTTLESKEDDVLIYRLIKVDQGFDLAFFTLGAITAQYTEPSKVPQTVLDANFELNAFIFSHWGVGTPEPASSPRSRAFKLNLLNLYDPNGIQIFNLLEKKETFDFFSNHSSSISGISSGIHESLHDLDKTDSSLHHLYLVGGAFVSMPSKGTLNRDVIYKDLTVEEQADDYSRNYFTGTSGQQGFHMLLEEFNAYTHGALTNLLLAEGSRQKDSVNEGFPAFIYYLEKYLKHARLSDPTTYQIIKSATVVSAIDRLWLQAVWVIGGICRSDYASLNANLISRAFKPENLEEISLVLGRPLKLPSSCNPKN